MTSNDSMCKNIVTLPSQVASDRPVVLSNARIVNPSESGGDDSILIHHGKIVEIGVLSSMDLPLNAQVIDVGGRVVSSGFIDLHLHGGKGASFNESDPALFDRIVDYHVARGTTSLLATLYVDEEDKLLRAIENVAEYIISKGERSVVKGIHLEGPFVNSRMRGAMNGGVFWPVRLDKWRLLEDASQGLVRMMTLAPELPGVGQIMKYAEQAGIKLAIGHSNASYEEVELAVKNGVTQVTHVFNAMTPMHHRKPGIVGAALLDNNLKVHLIADGVHVHPVVMKVLYMVKGCAGIVLISDATAATGETDGVYRMAGQTMVVKKNRVCLSDGTLAGSILTVSEAMKFMVRNVGVPLNEAVGMAAFNPACVLGIEQTNGMIAVGQDADIVVLNDNLNVCMTFVGGKVVYAGGLCV